jgi:sugar phosphate isomerase/epimerase
MPNPILISTAAYDGHSLPTALEEISGLGIRLVELAFIEGYTDPFTEDFFSGENADMITSLLEKNHLRCLSFSAHMDLSRASAVSIFKRRMEFAKRVGATYVISNAGPRHGRNDFMKNMETLAAFAANLKMIIALENPGDGKDNIIDSASACAEVIDAIGSDSVRVNYDFGNLISHIFGKVRPEEDYRLAMARTAHYHIKDVAPDDSGWHFTEIGKGAIDYGKILREIAAEASLTPLSLEIPLRISRSGDGSPRRAASRVDLMKIREVMAGSLRFIEASLSP